MKCKEYKTKSGKPIRLWQGDCMDLMKGKPENHWDLAITDPPYGLNFANEKERKAGRFKFECKNWDNTIPDKNYFNSLFKRTKNQIIWGGNYFLDHLYKTSCIIIWDKLNPKGMRFSDGEMAWGSFNKSLRIFKSQRTYQIENQIHPTQKPTALYRWLIANYAEEGDTILDTHGGSMSLAIACLIEDFELDIIELDEDYYNDAVERFERRKKREDKRII